MRSEYVCPVDGQTLEWHMKVFGHSSSGVIFFGDRLGCGFISPLDRTNYINRGAPSLTNSPEGK